ncbi:hypothetical protein [Pantoea sp. 18069]|uniref:hypothetical protein n=1 Tax=Pantoea sp. 18069 TaxID=2681415 RepID=UPI001358E43B|nr:hypothetical protein [Pantoea sp. 18069]
MHPIATSERPSSAIAAPASLPAPADAGQGVGTINEFDQDELNALRVLIKMRERAKFNSPQHEALIHACCVLKLRLEDKGIRA